MTVVSPDSKIKVLIVDDSAMMGKRIAEILEEDRDIQIVGRAVDGDEALQMIPTLEPDVVTLDVEMPRMNGITALKHIMLKHSIPTVMISALTQEGARITFDALKYGAIDVVAKPSRREDESLDAQKLDIVTKVKRAASIRIGRSRYVRTSNPGAPVTRMNAAPADPETVVIAIGGGTGGFYSLLKIVPHLPPDFGGVVAALVLSGPKYVDPFVPYLAEHCVIPVKHVRNAKTLEKGTCYLASVEDAPILTSLAGGGFTFKVTGHHAKNDGNSVIDGLLKSIARTVGRKSVGVVLSGPGSDGAEGVQEIRRSGGTGIIQDSNNCMDPSMPLAVLEKGTVEKILADYEMAEYFIDLNKFN